MPLASRIDFVTFDDSPLARIGAAVPHDQIDIRPFDGAAITVEPADPSRLRGRDGDRLLKDPH